MKEKRNKCIGVFDSGFGGLNILRGLVRENPDYNYIYLGDTARAPYGSRSKDVIYNFTRQAVNFLFSKGCGLVILACYTVSSDALRKIQRNYLPQKYPGMKVLGVLVPMAEEAARLTKNNRVGILATEGTVKSGSFVREFKKINQKIKVFQQACPLLVPIVEAGEHNSQAVEPIVLNYLKSVSKKGIDSLILGCTHYGILKKQIKKAAGKKMKIISGEQVASKKLKIYFKRHPEIEKKLVKNKKIIFYTTDLTEKFSTLGSRFFGKKIKAKKISL
jgi:glutamate racemase